MSDNSPWCPTCVNRKGDSLVCDACWSHIPIDMQDDYIKAKLALWEMRAKCLTYLHKTHEEAV